VSDTALTPCVSFHSYFLLPFEQHLLAPNSRYSPPLPIEDFFMRTLRNELGKNAGVLNNTALRCFGG